MKFLRKVGALFAIVAVAGTISVLQAYLNSRDIAELTKGPDPGAYEFLERMLHFEVMVVFLTVAFNFGYFIIRRIVGNTDAEAFRAGSAEFLILQQAIGATYIVVVRAYFVFGEGRLSSGTFTALGIAIFGLYRVIRSKIEGTYQKPKMNPTLR